MRLNIRQKLALAPVVCLLLFSITVAVTYYGEKRQISQNAVSNMLALQGMHLQQLLRGTNESLLTEGTPDSIAIAVAAASAFESGHQELLRTVASPPVLAVLEDQVDAEWLVLRRAVQRFLQTNAVSSEDDTLMMHYGAFLYQADQLRRKIEKLSDEYLGLVRESARSTTLLITVTTVLSLLGLAFLFQNLYYSIAIPLNDLRTSMLDVSDGEGKLLDRIERRVHTLPQFDEQSLRHEIMALDHAYQFMLEGFREYLMLRQAAQAELEQLNLELEQRIESRTYQLRVANEQMKQEIAQRKQIQYALEESRRDKSRILEAAGEGIFGTDAHGRISFVNPAAVHMLGHEVADMIGANAHALLHNTRVHGEAHPASECQALLPLCSGQCHKVDDELFWRKDGTGLPVEYTATPVEEKGVLIGVVVVFRDISGRKAIEDELRLAASIYQETPFGIMVTDQGGIIQRINHAFTTITGYSEKQAVGRSHRMLESDRHHVDFYHSISEAVTATGAWQGEIWSQHANGNVYPEWRSVTAVRGEDGRIIRLVSVFSDISEKKLSEDRIYRLAHYDVLTDLPNRTLFKERMEQAIIEARRHGSRLAVLFLDLDHFKYVNDTLGHPTGDQLLNVVARRLVDGLRQEDVVSRIGGDEFIVLLRNVRDSDSVSRVAGKLIEKIAEPVHLKGHQLSVSASIGISLYPHDGQDVATMHRNADIAMYRAKADGKGTFRFFTRSMNLAARARLELESMLRCAISEGGFELFYQPQVRLSDGVVTGLEALLRWNPPDGDPIGPDEFIPVAEDSGLIIPIGEWVLRTACGHFRDWVDRGIAPARFSVNLSARQFRDTSLIDKISQALQANGLEPSRLELELTESCVMEDPESSIDILGRLKAMGIQVAVDDFGIAYSSLGILKRLPIDRLKIDRSFIRDLPEDSDDAAITSTIIAMAHNLGLDAIAEGVEIEEQLALLRADGCDEMQGYFFSRPLPVADIQKLLAAGRRLELGTDGVAGVYKFERKRK